MANRTFKCVLAHLKLTLDHLRRRLVRKGKHSAELVSDYGKYPGRIIVHL